MVLKVQWQQKGGLKDVLWLLIILVVSRHCESATGTNQVPGRDFVWLVKLLKRGMTTIGKIATLISAGFTEYDVILAEHKTTSEDQ